MNSSHFKYAEILTHIVQKNINKWMLGVLCLCLLKFFPTNECQPNLLSQNVSSILLITRIFYCWVPVGVGSPTTKHSSNACAEQMHVGECSSHKFSLETNTEEMCATHIFLINRGGSEMDWHTASLRDSSHGFVDKVHVMHHINHNFHTACEYWPLSLLKNDKIWA